jgi:hypothetical protein
VRVPESIDLRSKPTWAARPDLGRLPAWLG